MNVIKEPAVCSGGSLKQTADKNYIHHTTYRKAIPLSSWKMFIGGLLLFGNKSQKVFWPFFDATLRQYLDHRQVSKSGSDKPGAKNSRQRVSGSWVNTEEALRACFLRRNY